MYEVKVKDIPDISASKYRDMLSNIYPCIKYVKTYFVMSICCFIFEK